MKVENARSNAPPSSCRQVSSDPSTPLPPVAMARNKHRKRNRPRIQRRTDPGSTPGTLHAAINATPTQVRIMAYGPQGLTEAVIRSVAEIPAYLAKYAMCWVNVDGLANTALIQQLGSLFGLHALALEDVVNVHQRAKVEPYESQLFIVVRMPMLSSHFESEQLSIFLGPNFLLTFQERSGDCLEPVRERLRKTSGQIRIGAGDYLMYAILDTVIDSYFPVVDSYVDRLDQLEVDVAAHQMPTTLEGIHEVRNELLLLRRSVRPHRDAVNELIRGEHPLISHETRLFLRDCYDHTMQLIDLLEVYREMCGDLREFYLSLASNRMNEVMKVLTIISTIFIPLSFITGLYGMNFDTSFPWNMPELRWPYGYAFVLGTIISVTAGMIAFFFRRGWIGDRWRRRR